MKYNNAPIVEAIFDIRVSNTEIENVAEIEKLSKSILSDFPITNKRVNFEGKIELNAQKEDFSSKGISNVSGYIFSNRDNNRKIQFRTDGYTCNFLMPYTDWNEFSSLALKYWNSYLDFGKPKIITRIALRYINKIDLPIDSEFQFEKYLRSVPRIPGNLPQTFNQYFLQMKVPCGNPNIETTVSQTFEKPKSNYLPFIIDIDVYNNTILQSQEDLSPMFDELREIKNGTFEELITDESRKLFN